ncbi:PAS domain-containing sensor histidine kinase [Spirosoma utsteinense]|uniref:histidine kinase n=1 Tax=Spirosoma utsteinense TaxID=2585773 RepID=A0ABR6WG77_9BACT|nr:ATP-binding protein [Spirosoma utsteinense]MBC3788607.1 PAS domain S-box-containing protein [Spirosoma utsteinense]MBC3795238.1 PAS domain S-box-containing protein [Spirosoma utsteinense]
MTGEQTPFNIDMAAQNRRLAYALQAANVGTWDYDFGTNQVQWSPICKALFGLPADTDVTAAILLQQVHPEDRDRVHASNMQALNPTSKGDHDIVFRTLQMDGTIRWVQAKGLTLWNDEGQLIRFSGVVQDVTEQVVARQQLEESDRFSRTVFYNSPVAKLVYVGDEMILREANEMMLAILGRTSSIIGKPLLESVPELKGTQLTEQYHRVLATAETYVKLAEPIELIRNDVPYQGYYNYTYKPLLNTAGDVYGVICTVIEVTTQVIAHQKLEEAEAGLRNAIELAQLGTWSIDVAANRLTLSDRLIEWLGYDPQPQTFDKIISGLEAGDRMPFKRALAWALNPESGGVFNVTSTVVHPQTGQKRILHAQGKTVFDAAGKAVRLIGTAQDITLQRNMQQTLENEVSIRTQELAVSNQELAASIDEYAAINEELEEANRLLYQSNNNLQEFAYVASHDLQEPLRKIQQFGDILRQQFGDQLGSGVGYLERMQSAALRMSNLIRDLLSFSRISTGQEQVELVHLGPVIDQILIDLELRIQETGAVVRVASLPSVNGDASQLSQLFQNLISNALKFRNPSEAVPLVHIQSEMVAAMNLPPAVKPARLVNTYHRIDVIDNGIGFEEQYIDRIFQVFQRLHGRSEYAGTGIGLAIAKKVVVNHGGAITAHSAPGQGATFSVYLPA